VTLLDRLSESSGLAVLVGRQRTGLAGSFHRRDAASVHQAVCGRDRFHFGMTIEERDRAHVLLDQVLRVAPRHEREHEHAVDAGQEVRCRGRKQD